MSTDPGTNFVVLTTQRNGSTWFMSLLTSLDSVSAHGELFLPRPRSPEKRWDSDFAYPRYIESRARHGSLRPFSVFAYLTTLYNSPGSVGFKLMYSQLKQFPEIIVYLKHKRIPVVHLVRRNHLDVMISFQLKRAVGRAHILSPADRPTDMKIDIDTSTILKDLQRLQFKHDVGRRLLRFSGLPYLEVAYEDLLTDGARLTNVLAFLNIEAPGQAPHSNILKTRLADQREVIRNYDEVRRVLENSRFADLLD